MLLLYHRTKGSDDENKLVTLKNPEAEQAKEADVLKIHLTESIFSWYTQLNEISIREMFPFLDAVEDDGYTLAFRHDVLSPLFSDATVPDELVWKVTLIATISSPNICNIPDGIYVEDEVNLYADTTMVKGEPNKIVRASGPSLGSVQTVYSQFRQKKLTPKEYYSHWHEKPVADEEPEAQENTSNIGKAS